MKDIVITSKQIRKELITLLVCFLISFLSNIGAIIYYKSPIAEILTSLPYVLSFSVFIYVFWSFIRVLKSVLLKMISRK
jgi:hypothetical protein